MSLECHDCHCLICALLDQVAATLYVGGGVAHAVKVQGRETSEGMKLLPHREFWTSVHGVCADGLIFAQREIAKRIGGGGGGYDKVRDSGQSNGDAPTKSEADREAAVQPVKMEEESEDDDEDLAE